LPGGSIFCVWCWAVSATFVWSVIELTSTQVVEFWVDPQCRLRWS
jgi:hypothetical protein